MVYFMADSKIMKSTCNNNHHIFEAEFMVSEPFFDNTAYFYTAASILNFNPNSKNPFVFLFLIRNYSRKGN